MQTKLDTIVSQQLIVLKQINKWQCQQVQMHTLWQSTLTQTNSLPHTPLPQPINDHPSDVVIQQEDVEQNNEPLSPVSETIDVVETTQDTEIVVEPTDVISTEPAEPVDQEEDHVDDTMKFYKTTPSAVANIRSVPVRKTIKRQSKK